MAVQSLSLSYSAVQSSYSYSSNSTDNSKTTTQTNATTDNKQSSTPQQSVVSGNYSSEKLLLNYTNSDGDSLTLSSQSIDFQKSAIAANQDPTDASWKKIIADIKDQYMQMKADLVNQLFGSGQDSSNQGTPKVADPRAFDETKAIPGLPDYWSADKTSQRIVDFATSFLSAFKGSGSDFLSMIKDAIDKGFSQAKDMFGDVPSEISKLTDKTHALVMDKLDKWASDQGIVTDTSNNQSA